MAVPLDYPVVLEKPAGVLHLMVVHIEVAVAVVVCYEDHNGPVVFAAALAVVLLMVLQWCWSTVLFAVLIVMSLIVLTESPFHLNFYGDSRCPS